MVDRAIRQAIGLAALLATTASALWSCTSKAPPSRGATAPNVLLISIDTLRPDHLGCYGYERETSPNIDRLAREGTLFKEHISSSSWTLPAHAALFTSVADSVHGVVDPRSTALAPQFTTLAERFAAAGYDTVGLFAGPYLHPAFGLAQGFDDYIDCTAYSAEMQSDRQQWIFKHDVMLGSHRDVTNERVYGEARAWLERQQAGDAPFFAFLHLWDVHFDFIPPAPYDSLFDPDYEGAIDGRDFFYDNSRYRADMAPKDLHHLLALYDGEVRWTDEVVGRLLADLQQWGIEQNTIVALTSDHGTEFFEHGGKMHRTTLFDELVRIPLILRYPGKVPAGALITEQTRIIDVGPTLLELAGVALPAQGTTLPAQGTNTTWVAGRSLLALMGGAGREPGGQPGDQPLAPYPALSELVADGKRLRSMRTKNAKLIEHLDGGGLIWFDLEHDPEERIALKRFDVGRGAELARDYLKTVSALESAVAHRPGEAASPDLSAGVQAQLRAFGYIGDEEDGD